MRATKKSLTGGKLEIHTQKKRVPVKFLKGEPDKWPPPGFEWVVLESIYGDRPFNDDHRTAIADAVNRYFRRASLEFSAPFASDFASRLRKAHELAQKLSDEVGAFDLGVFLVAPHWHSHFEDDDLEDYPDEVDDEEEKEISSAIWEDEAPRKLNARNFQEVILALSKTFDSAVAEFDRNGALNFLEGDAWIQLVVDLASEFKSRLFKVSASNDTYREPSKFLAFVKNLQSTFDVRFQLHTPESGFRKAVSKGIRRSKIEAATRAENCAAGKREKS